MKLSIIVMALAAVSSGVAFAAPPPDAQIGLSSGASAARGSLRAALRDQCVNIDAGVVTQFAPSLAPVLLPNTGAIAAPLGNVATFVCHAPRLNGLALTAADYSGSPVDAVVYRRFSENTDIRELRLNVAGGSFTSVQTLNGICDSFLNPGTGTSNTCPTLSNGVLIGGLTDVEPEGFPPAVIGTLTANSASATVAQTFGVAASTALYNAMFADQLAPAGSGATAAKPIPNNFTAPAVPCTTSTTDRLECIPTISKGQMASIMNNAEFNQAKVLGARFLAPSLAAGSRLRYARRVNTSGSQASAQIYFLGLPCTASAIPVIAQPTTTVAGETLAARNVNAVYRVLAAPGTSDVLGALNATDAGREYTIGVISGENNPATASWRWLRVQGAAIGENSVPGSAGITNRATAANGQYDFYFETKYVFLTADQESFWIDISTALGAVTPPVGLLQSSDLAGFNKGGAACSPSFSN